ncbi:MAG: FAD-binding oxidoreductase [Gemmatimonadota bacterium]
MARPADVDDVRNLTVWAADEGVALVPRGTGTGMPGHNVGPGVVVELEGPFRRIGPVDRERRVVRVGPAAVAADVADAVAAEGLCLPALPSSADRCTVGGMVATNAAGARSFRHGSIRERVAELEVVLADGDVVRVGRNHPLPGAFQSLRERFGEEPRLGGPGWPRVRKNSSGYALPRFLETGDGAQLLVGSEGTLGIVTSVLLHLETPTPGRAVALLALPALEALPEVAARAEAAGASACEYLGRRILEMARLDEDTEYGPLSRRSAALMLVELAGEPEGIEQGMESVRELAGDLGTRLLEAWTPESCQRLWELRHRASPTITAAAERGRVSAQFIEDSVVPPACLPSYVAGLGEILARTDTDAVVFGHAGDGNLHVNPLLDVGDARWLNHAREILERTVDLVAELGGTLSGEHGDGRVRAPFLERIWSGGCASAFREVKETLDPGGILNPGVIVPLAGQDPLEGFLERTERSRARAGRR